MCVIQNPAESRLSSPLPVRLLQLGVPIVFDFRPATRRMDRAWVRSIFEKRQLPTMCCIISSRPMNRAKRDLHLRNETKPEGLYFGFVSEDRFR